MKPHIILVDFNGSQDGRFTQKFEAGTTRELSEYLASIVVPCGWARQIDFVNKADKTDNAAIIAAIDNKAIATDGKRSYTSKSKIK